MSRFIYKKFIKIKALIIKLENKNNKCYNTSSYFTKTSGKMSR